MNTEMCEICFKEITHEEVVAAESYYLCGGQMCVSCAIGMFEGAILDEEDRVFDELQEDMSNGS